jgi:hypothetical protein
MFAGLPGLSQAPFSPATLSTAFLSFWRAQDVHASTFRHTQAHPEHFGPRCVADDAKGCDILPPCTWRHQNQWPSAAGVVGPSWRVARTRISVRRCAIASVWLWSQPSHGSARSRGVASRSPSAPSRAIRNFVLNLPSRETQVSVTCGHLWSRWVTSRGVIPTGSQSRVLLCHLCGLLWVQLPEGRAPRGQASPV